MRYLNELYTLRFGGCGLTRAAAAAWLGVTERTLRRHETLPVTKPGPIYRALRLRAGYLEEVHPSWRDWRIVKDRLYWPGDRWGLSAGEIMAISFERQRIRELERQLAAVKQPVMATTVIPFLPALQERNG